MEYINKKLDEFNKNIIDYIIKYKAINGIKFLYDNYNFIEYLKYSFLAKYYERKINTIIILVSLLNGIS